MVSVTTTRTGNSNDVSIATATVDASLFGRAVTFSFSGYNFGSDVFGGNSNAITFGMAPAKSNGCDMAAAQRGIVLFRNTDKRLIEQRLIVPRLSGEVLGFSCLSSMTEELGEVGTGRELSKIILRKFESAVETVRQSIIRNLGCELRAVATNAIHKLYGRYTSESVRSILGAVNWAYLLSQDGRQVPRCGEQATSVLLYTLDHNPPAFHAINFTGMSEIPLLSKDSISFDRQKIADIRATTLLAKVCGKVHAEWFKRRGYIVVENNGYTFQIRPNAFVDCTDPNDKHGKLCIHTTSHTCNPIDEVIIAYLNILYHFDEYMDMAIVHSPQAGFMMPAKSKCVSV